MSVQTLAYCWCGCPFAAHDQQLKNQAQIDRCEDHGVHKMENAHDWREKHGATRHQG